MTDPYQAPKSSQSEPLKTETRLSIQERHRIERFKAKSSGINVLLMTVLIAVGGLAVSFAVGFITWWIFLLVGGITWSIDKSLTRARINKVVAKHEQELKSFESPIAITDFETD